MPGVLLYPPLLYSFGRWPFMNPELDGWSTSPRSTPNSPGLTGMCEHSCHFNQASVDFNSDPKASIFLPPRLLPRSIARC